MSDRLFPKVGKSLGLFYGNAGSFPPSALD